MQFNNKKLSIVLHIHILSNGCDRSNFASTSTASDKRRCTNKSFPTEYPLSIILLCLNFNELMINLRKISVFILSGRSVRHSLFDKVDVPVAISYILAHCSTEFVCNVSVIQSSIWLQFQ